MSGRSSSLRIIVAGLVGSTPVGGMAWHYLQYLVGLSRLGHDVYYHEDTWSWPFHPVRNRHVENGDYSAEYIENFVERYAPKLRGHWHYLHLHERSFGMTRAVFDDVARTADVFLNVSGASFLPDSLSPDCVKIFLDTDPGYNQIVLSERFGWSENVERWAACVSEHDRHFTFAENIRGADCLIPKLDFEWETTRMPVVMDLWSKVSSQPAPPSAPWTTVMTWNAFKGKLVHGGVEYRSKGSEFEKVIDLPRSVEVPLRVAVGGVDAPLARLSREGWQVEDGPSASLTPDRYQQFIAASRGEFSVAKQVYTAMRSGWFSERSTCYLASGRPAVVQETGFSKFVPTGEGLLSFNTKEEAIGAISEVEGNYARHSKAAVEIARGYFDSDAVLDRLIGSAIRPNAAPAASER